MHKPAVPNPRHRSGSADCLQRKAYVHAYLYAGVSDYVRVCIWCVCVHVCSCVCTHMCVHVRGCVYTATHEAGHRIKGLHALVEDCPKTG